RRAGMACPPTSYLKRDVAQAYPELRTVFPTNMPPRIAGAARVSDSRLSRGGGEFFFDRRADEVAPLGPRAVVILHVVVAEQIFQHEPRVRAALADSAVGDHFARAGHALALIELLQLVRGLERAVLVGSLRPRDVRGGGNVPSALRRFAHARRRDDLAGEFIDRTHVHELAAAFLFEDGEDVLLAGAETLVLAGRTVRGGRDLGGVGRERALFFRPFLASAVDQADVLVPVVFELPEGIGREPI